MGMMGGRMIGRLGIAATLLVAITANASEQCQRLVARGQVAWVAGRVTDAEDLFAAAVAADPNDAEAQYGLGVALARQGRTADAERALRRVLELRPGDPAARRALDHVKARTAAAAPTAGPEAAAGPTRPWTVHGRAAVGYDSNVQLLSDRSGGRRGDAVFQLGAGASWLAFSQGPVRLQLDYDFDQTLHPRIQAYDLRTNRIAGTLSVARAAGRWASLNGGVEHYSLGSHQYLLDPFVQPYLSYEWADVGVSQLYYRHGEPDYLSNPFKNVRSGQTNATGISQTLYLGAPERQLSLGYAYDDENPRARSGDDYQRSGHTVSVGTELPLGWETTAHAAYGYRRDNYHERNSNTGFTKARRDDAHTYGVGLTRPLTEAISLRLDYEGTTNGSNIELFDYHRHLVVLGIEAKF